MTRTYSRKRRTARNQPATATHSPHWSWSRKDGPPSGAPIAADEFWSRLGL